MSGARPARGVVARLGQGLAGLVAATALLVIGCDTDRSVVVTDFSRPLRLDAPRSTSGHVWGLELHITGQASEPMHITVASDDTALRHIDLPAGGTYEGRFDWYAQVARLSFGSAPAATGKLTIVYRFLRT